MVSRSTLGVNTASLVSCKKSEYHGFHPSNEVCRYCSPDQKLIDVKIDIQPKYDWNSWQAAFGQPAPAKPSLPGFPGWEEYEPGVFAPRGYRVNNFYSKSKALTAKMTLCQENLPAIFHFTSPTGTYAVAAGGATGKCFVGDHTGYQNKNVWSQLDVLAWLQKIPVRP